MDFKTFKLDPTVPIVYSESSMIPFCCTGEALHTKAKQPPPRVVDWWLCHLENERLAVICKRSLSFLSFSTIEKAKKETFALSSPHFLRNCQRRGKGWRQALHNKSNLQLIPVGGMA